jgi:hypothetical protein
MNRVCDLPSRPAQGRLAALPAWGAWLVLLLVAGLSLSTVGGAGGPPAAAAARSVGAAGTYTDRELYREVVRRVGEGQDYWAAAAAAQRGHGYPTAPPWAFREPALAWTLALLRSDLLRWGAFALLAAAALALMRDAADQAPGPTLTLARVAGGKPDPTFPRPAWRRIAVTLLFGVGLTTPVAAPAAAYLHEAWAAVLIGLSLACWRPQGPWRWGLAAAFGLMACLVREIALPYLLVMAAFAVAGRRRGESLAWGAALAVLAAALAAHFVLAARQHLPADGVSPGWMRLGGWPFAVLAAQRNIVLAVLPAPLASLVLLAGLLGLVSARSPWLDRIAATVGAFLLLFTVVGRPDNYYWGLMIAPLLAMGLPYAPAALADLVRAARLGGRSVSLNKISSP